MIIQCEQCKTKFKLDDAKVKDKGVKVRCAKCRNVFTVSKDQSQPAERPDFAAMLEQNTGVASVSASSVAFEIEHEPVSEPTGGFDFDTSSFAMDENSEKPLSAEKDVFELAPEEPVHGTTSAEEFDISSLAWNDEASVAVDDSAAGSDKIDFSGISADGTAPDADKTIVASSSFTDIDDLSALDVSTEQVKPDLDGFMDSMAAHDSTGFDLAKETSSDDAFNLGEIDFGDELATLPGHQINPEKFEIDDELLFVPLDADQNDHKDAKSFSAMTEPDHAHLHAKKYDEYEENIDMVKPWTLEELDEEVQEKELPPLSISSRRKSASPMFLSLVSLIVAGVVAIMVFIGLDMNGGDKTKSVVEDGGKIVLRNVTASFVNNKTVGDLLVISGEAVNNYDTPRAAIQVMGSVYGVDNKVLLTKNAYAGNPISKEQLTTMPAEKIEAAMSNQFGDSLANMELAPGKSIQFVVVISNVPVEAKQFSCNMIGSTGALPPKK